MLWCWIFGHEPELRLNDTYNCYDRICGRCGKFLDVFLRNVVKVKLLALTLRDGCRIGDLAKMVSRYRVICGLRRERHQYLVEVPLAYRDAVKESLSYEECVAAVTECEKV